MTTMFFKPWVGPDYERGWKGLKTLVVGESHYEWEDNQTLKQSLTQDCIEDQIRGDFTKRFWTNIVVAFLGHRPTLEEKQTYWHSVGFYNYVQESVGFGARVRPKSRMWKGAAAPFQTVIAQYKPQFLAVMGKQLWNNLPELGGYCGPKIKGAPSETTWVYPVSDSEKCLAFPLRHPSAGFSGQGFHPFLLKAHAQAAARRF